MTSLISIVIFIFSCNFLSANNVNKFDDKRQEQNNAYATAPIVGRPRAFGSATQQQQQQSPNSPASAANGKQIFIGVPTPPPVPRPYYYRRKSISQNDNGTLNNKQIFIGVPTPPPVPRVPVPYGYGSKSISQQQQQQNNAEEGANKKQIFIGVPTPPPVPRVPVPYDYGSKRISHQQQSAAEEQLNNNGNNKQIFIGVPTPPPVPRVPYANQRTVARGVALRPQQRVNYAPTPPPIPPIPAIPYPFHQAKRRSISENDEPFTMSNGPQRFFPRGGSHKYAYIIHGQKDALLLR